MTFNLTVNESCGAVAQPEQPATHNIRVHYNETDAGHVSGPFSLSAATSAAIAAIARNGVVKVTIEPVEA